MSAVEFATVGFKAAENPTKENVNAFVEYNDLKHETFAKYVKLGSAAGLGYAFAGAFGSMFASGFANDMGAGGSSVAINDNYIGDLPMADDLPAYGGTPGDVYSADGGVIGGFTTNPTIGDLENGGSGAGLPGGLTPNATNFPSLSDIRDGVKTLLTLRTQDIEAQAKLESARRSNAAPTSTTPNFRAFGSSPGTGGFAADVGSIFGNGGVSNMPAIVVAVIVIVLSLFLIKR